MNLFVALVFLQFLSLSIAFDFGEFFEGNWNVTTSSVVGDEQFEESQQAVEYYITKNEAESGLTGHYSTEKGDAMSVKVAFTDAANTEGTFSLSSDGNDWHSLFDFAFQALSNEVVVSNGVFTPMSSDSTARYQFTITSETSFLLNVYDGDAVSTMIGRKYVQVVPPTFLQKYGTMILMMCFMAFTQYLKYRMQPNLAAPQQQAAGATKGKRGRAKVQRAPKTE
eukprot:Plantae.Rhodophyta-Palmaria_palmata.ctg15112.p1 GENE.Plantae.Rhodophyta-Palmaria_palmata.ctg15112~~Plantae.Rhodophyta-Palmaria_palmata.ctg15112.p1  ORF type:complete len:224 (-),score=40.16 Plantae.Rhodophyta-Palmaria_palmata.ctg15112:3-674(-)